VIETKTKRESPPIQKNILLVDGTSADLFAWIVPQEKFAVLAPVLKKILASFELVNP
jgi:hypothetical protein